MLFRQKEKATTNQQNEQPTNETKMSFTNGHPTRKFRNIKPLHFERESDTYLFEGFEIRIPQGAESFKGILPQVSKQVAECREDDGISEKTLCDFAIEKTRKVVLKIKELSASWKGKSITHEFKKENATLQVDYAHGVITCAYLGACVWGEQFSIFLADGTMPLVPEDEIGAVCRLINQKICNAFEEDEKKEKEEEKKQEEEYLEIPFYNMTIRVKKDQPNVTPAPPKFTDLFKPENIKFGEKWFLEESKEGKFPDQLEFCKDWATGKRTTEEIMSISFEKSKISYEEFEKERKSFVGYGHSFLFLFSKYNTNMRQIDTQKLDGFEDELKKSGFHIISQSTETDDEWIAFLGIYTDAEMDAVMKDTPDARLMARNEGKSGAGRKVKVSEMSFNPSIKHKVMLPDPEPQTEPQPEPKPEKPMRLCECGCGTTAKKMKKSLCCSARYVDETHQKKHWAEHKKVCVNYKKKEVKPVFQMPTTLEEELAMWVCPPSCESCEFCEYKPQFCAVEID